MKRILLAVVLMLTVMIAGCTFVQPLQIDAKWVPRTDSADTYWRLLVSAQTKANADVPHSWSIDWGDGTVEEWSSGERNWPKYPMDNSRFVDIHDYTIIGEYIIDVCVDGKSASIACVVGSD